MQKKNVWKSKHWHVNEGPRHIQLEKTVFQSIQDLFMVRNPDHPVTHCFRWSYFRCSLDWSFVHFQSLLFDMYNKNDWIHILHLHLVDMLMCFIVISSRWSYVKKPPNIAGRQISVFIYLYSCCSGLHVNFLFVVVFKNIFESEYGISTCQQANLLTSGCLNVKWYCKTLENSHAFYSQ